MHAPTMYIMIKLESMDHLCDMHILLYVPETWPHLQLLDSV